MAHSGSVLASAVGAVSFAQIVKACEPVFAAIVGLLIPPMELKPLLAYAMLIPIVGGVGLACIKEGKGVDINVEAFLFVAPPVFVQDFGEKKTVMLGKREL